MGPWNRLQAAGVALMLAFASCAKQQALVGPSPDRPPQDRPPLGPVPELLNVQAPVRGAGVTITFDPVDGAQDYRVYLSPSASDVIDGGTAIRNAIYRCAGDREAPRAPTDGEPQLPGGAIQTFVNHDVEGFSRTTNDATLGHVYSSQGSGRVPVYAMGDPGPDADNSCYFQRWRESRVKKYVTTDADRASLRAAGWRDDGIVFYTPASGSGTRNISTAVVNNTRLYFADDSSEASARAGSTAAFAVLATPGTGTQPLMRVHYSNGCGRSHDELVRGQAAFARAVHQGNVPVNAVQYAGLSGPTTLVVEALDQGCPFQGYQSPAAFPAQTQSGIAHQRYFTIAEQQAAAPNGEVFVNGQHDPANVPRAIARSYVDIAPAAPEPLDFYDGFDSGTSPGPLTEVGGMIFQSKRFDSRDYDITFYSVEFPIFAIGPMLGELFVTYADWAADTNGKFRLTPKRMATLAADAFLHVTMEVDIVTTSRRYPQILISDRSPPVQDALPQGFTIIVQTFGEWPPRIDVELCNHRTWDVNNQCPRFPLQPEPLRGFSLPPHQEIGELFGVDRRVRFDVHASTQQVYVAVDGQPWGCANLPTGTMPAGPVSVTYADVLYHSGVDVVDPPYTFHHNHMAVETRRHFGQIGFASGVPAPAWDTSRLPCVSTMLP